MEIDGDRQRQKETNRDRRRQKDIERDRKRQKEKEIERDRKRYKEKEIERDRKIKKEIEGDRKRQKEIERDRKKQKEIERDRKRQIVIDGVRWKQLEVNFESWELDSYRQRWTEMIKERYIQIEMERDFRTLSCLQVLSGRLLGNLQSYTTANSQLATQIQRDFAGTWSNRPSLSPQVNIQIDRGDVKIQ